MATDFQTWAAHVGSLHRALGALEPLARKLHVETPQGTEWYELLQRKLLPQLNRPPLLVAAVVGGTNIGKSVIFNHLAGEITSAVSPMAAGTKHPVCLVPPGFDDIQLLTELFVGFDLYPWENSEQALTDSDEHRMFWRVGRQVPDQLLLLDTPDIDSDARVNWQRAECIRRSADVLIAVLTQQKYNDAAVKRFFRTGADSDKPLIVVFNQCELEADSEYWPQWLATFVEETEARPLFVYVVPYDRQAAEGQRLPFFDVGPLGTSPLGEPSNLREDLASLHFDEIKIRTFRGALHSVLDPQQGAPSYLAEVRAASAEFAAAAEALSASEMARVSWPALPSRMLVDEIRTWWDESRSNWSRRVHGFYRTIGRQAARPVTAAWRAVSGPSIDPLEAFRIQERDAVILAVEKLLGELQRLSQVGNETLRPRLQALLSGSARADLLLRVQAAHDQLPAIDDQYRATLRDELQRWSRDNPRAVRWLRSLDHVVAIARPAVTVTLAFSGWFLASGLVEEAAIQATAHTATGLATEAAITTGVTGGGEAILGTTAESMRLAAGRIFRTLQAGYAQQRAAWLAGWLESEMLGGLLGDLRHGAGVPRQQEYQDVLTALENLEAATAELS
jgi:hypothetical protein